MSLQVTSGPWTTEQIRQFWSTTVIPIRLATTSSSGPTVQSLWFLPVDDALWCCTQRDALVVRRLTADPSCGFEIAADHPPYRGVRGHGTAALLPDQAGRILPALLARYGIPHEGSLAQWLLSRIDSEVAIQITDLTVSTWDFSERMQDALSAPPTSTQG